MRICNEGQQKERLRYEDLPAGAVFKFVVSTGDLWLKLANLSCVRLRDGKHARGKSARGCTVTHYPNACINPGEPE